MLSLDLIKNCPVVLQSSSHLACSLCLLYCTIQICNHQVWYMHMTVSNYIFGICFCILCTYILKCFFRLSTTRKPHKAVIPLLTKKKAMNNFKKSQILMLSLLAALLFISPLLSSSLRPTYLYFVLNFLIISLGAEAGLLSFFSRPLEDNRKPFKPVPTKKSSTLEPNDKKQQGASSDECNEKKAKAMEKTVSEELSEDVKVEKVKKCPSTPSLFFIGAGKAETELRDAEEFEEGEDELGGEELFAKAESFIGNFNKQLKMQREESWKKIHEFYKDVV